MSTAPHYAGFWRRLGATLIDALLLLSISFVLLYLAYGSDYFASAHERQGLFNYYGVSDFLINQVLPLVAAVYLWVSFRGTPGKLLLDCQVVDADSGQALSMKQAVLRYFAYLVSMLPLCLGFLWIAWDKRKQGFHDKIARTVVVYRPDDLSQKSLRELQKEAQ